MSFKTTFCAVISTVLIYLWVNSDCSTPPLFCYRFVCWDADRESSFSWHNCYRISSFCNDWKSWFWARFSATYSFLSSSSLDRGQGLWANLVTSNWIQDPKPVMYHLPSHLSLIWYESYLPLVGPPLLRNAASGCFLCISLLPSGRRYLLARGIRFVLRARQKDRDHANCLLPLI